MAIPDPGSLIAGGGIFLGLVLVLFLLRQGGTAPRLLAAAMALAVLNILHGRLLFPQSLAMKGLLFEPLQFALPPLFAAYVRALLAPAWRPHRRDLIHFLPLTLMGAITISLAGALPAAAGLLVLVPGAILSLVFWLLLLVQALVYLSRANIRIRRYRRALPETVSTLAGIDQGWLLWYSRSLHVLYLAYAVVPAVLIHANSPEAARHLIGFSLCLMIGALACHQLLARQDQVAAVVTARTTTAAWDPLLPAALAEAMAVRQLYRNPGLGLVDLAEAVGWPRNEVSAAINRQFGQSFHDFVNSWRVEEAKRLMLAPENRHLTLLALGLAAGFNSKPTFNAVFKKTTGLTPSAWLQQNREKV